MLQDRRHAWETYHFPLFIGLLCKTAALSTNSETATYMQLILS